MNNCSPLPCADVANSQKLVATNLHAVNCRDVDGRHSTPLHFAAGYNRVSVVEYLLEHGADVHAKDKGSVNVSVTLYEGNVLADAVTSGHSVRRLVFLNRQIYV